MGPFTFVPLWVLEDLVILALGLAALIFIAKREERPLPILLELFSFCFLYASVYENFATLMKWYGYGRSVLMIFNVPFTIPLVEYLVLYSVLRLAEKARLPVWSRPFAAGLAGMVFDFSLDPVAIRQVLPTLEGRMGRWTWYPAATDAQLYGEPVYNFSGWILLCSFAAATFLLGRSWYRRSGHKTAVAMAYPPLMSLAALGILVSPLSRFILWLGPFQQKGSRAEWLMLAIDGLACLTVCVVAALKGAGGSAPARRINGAAAFKEESLPLLVLGALPLVNVVTCVIGGYWEVLWLVCLAALAMSIAALWAATRGWDQVASAPGTADSR